MVDLEFQGFEKKRLEIIEHMKDLDSKVIKVEQNKLDEHAAVDQF